MGNPDKPLTLGLVIRFLLAVFLPPLGVFLTVGLGLQFWLNIPLTLCFGLPGMIHAVWIVARRS